MRRMKREFRRISESMVYEIYVKKLKLQFGAQSKSNNSRPIIDDNQGAGEMYTKKENIHWNPFLEVMLLEYENSC